MVLGMPLSRFLPLNDTGAPILGNMEKVIDTAAFWHRQIRNLFLGCHRCGVPSRRFQVIARSCLFRGRPSFQIRNFFLGCDGGFPFSLSSFQVIESCCSFLGSSSFQFRNLFFGCDGGFPFFSSSFQFNMVISSRPISPPRYASRWSMFSRN